MQGLTVYGDSPCGKEVIALRKKAHSKKRKSTDKKQWRDYLPVISHFAAALYWFVRLVLMLIDWFNR